MWFFFSKKNCVVPTDKYIRQFNMNDTDTFRLPHLFSIPKDQDILIPVRDGFLDQLRPKWFIRRRELEKHSRTFVIYIPFERFVCVLKLRRTTSLNRLGQIVFIQKDYGHHRHGFPISTIKMSGNKSANAKRKSWNKVGKKIFGNFMDVFIKTTEKGSALLMA